MKGGWRIEERGEQGTERRGKETEGGRGGGLIRRGRVISVNE